MVSNLDMTDALLVIIVVLVVYYLLMNNRTPEGYTNNNKSKPTMILYHAKWCGHCKTLMPTWEKFKKQAKINAVEYEADENPKEMKEAGVNGFPTIKCRNKQGVVLDFKGERTVAGLNAFAKQCSK